MFSEISKNSKPLFQQLGFTKDFLRFRINAHESISIQGKTETATYLVKINHHPNLKSSSIFYRHEG